MDRLTTRNAGEAYLLCAEECTKMDMDCIDCRDYQDAIDRLAAYEDTGLEPEEVPTALEMAKMYAAFKELDNYRQAESEGRLIVLPCKVGDTVFEITNLPGDGAIQMRFVAEIAWLSGHGTVLLSPGLVIGFDDFGKTVFLTREEAEAALGGAAP